MTVPVSMCQPGHRIHLDMCIQLCMCLSAFFQPFHRITQCFLQLHDPFLGMFDILFRFVDRSDAVLMEPDLGLKYGVQQFFCFRDGEYTTDEFYFHGI